MFSIRAPALRRTLAPACASALILAFAGTGQVQSATPPQEARSALQSLMQRIGDPATEAINEFKRAGMSDIRPHILTDRERRIVAAALANLPPFNRKVLLAHLHRLAFLDGIPGEGSGLTSPAGGQRGYDITLRASLIEEDLSDFLTKKEQRLFRSDDNGVRVVVQASGVNALSYVLMHESSHVVDLSCGITQNASSPLDAGIWAGPTTLEGRYSGSLAANTYFRGGGPIPRARAEELYDDLSRTPFVSAYATASAREDFAELVAWHWIARFQNGNLRISLTERGDTAARRWYPLHLRRVVDRLNKLDKLQTSRSTCKSWRV